MRFPSKWTKIFPICAVLLLTCGVYINSLNNDFALDDEQFIIQSDFIKDWRNAFTIFTPEYFSVSGSHVDLNRPMMTWSLILDYAIWGLNPFGYHLTNIVLHIINTLLIYLLGMAILKDKYQPLLAALIFGINPINTEAVNGINFREDLLATAFYLLVFIAVVRHDSIGKSDKYYLFSLFFFACALLSKETAVMLPFVLILYHYAFVNRTLKSLLQNNAWFYVALFALLFLYLAGLSILYLYTDLPKVDYSGHEWYTTVPIGGKFISHYIHLMIFPIDLSIDHNPLSIRSFLDIGGLISLCLAAAAICLSFIGLKRQPVPSFFSLWFFVNLFPVAGTFYQQPFAERFLYFPSIGWSFLIAMLLIWLYEHVLNRTLRTALIMSIFLIIVFYAWGTANRNARWKDNFALWTDAVKKAPESQRAHFNLGREYHLRGIYSKAIEEYHKAMKTGHGRMILIDPEKPWIGIGLSYRAMGEHYRSVAAFESALSLAPNDPIIHYNLALAYKSIGMTAEAIEGFRRAINLNPEYFFARMELADMYVKIGDYEKAIEEYNEIMRIKPDGPFAGMAKSFILKATNLIKEKKKKGDANPFGLLAGQ